MNSQIFINKANIIHNYVYDYTNTIYLNSGAKVIIICKVHGEFFQTPENHTHKVNPQGCPVCGRLKANEKHKNNAKNKFKTKAIKVHNNKYSYDNFNYISAKTKSLITCPIHGDFAQCADKHLQKRGCPKCALELNLFCLKTFKMLCIKNNNNLGIFYIIKCFNESECFYKLGITSKSIKERYRTKHKMPYKYEIIQEVVDTPENIWQLEKLLKEYVKNFKYTPLIIFGGYTETFIV